MVNHKQGGSSPRGRGTPPRRRDPMTLFRFIPARAGNAQSSNNRHPLPSVHPRAGGERSKTAKDVLRSAGSSPRGRGTLDTGGWSAAYRRFIPARAGNARSRRRNRCCWTVHPRAGGERCQRHGLSRPVHGSSPRGRGTLSPFAPTNGITRFIPARAGNAGLTLSPLRETRRPRGPTVHPRAGGERSAGPG